MKSIRKHPSPSELLHAQRARQANALRQSGCTFRQIQAAMGLRGPEQARRLVARGKRLDPEAH